MRFSQMNSARAIGRKVTRDSTSKGQTNSINDSQVGFKPDCRFFVEHCSNQEVSKS